MLDVGRDESQSDTHQTRPTEDGTFLCEHLEDAVCRYHDCPALRCIPRAPNLTRVLPMFKCSIPGSRLQCSKQLVTCVVSSPKYP